MRQKDRDEGRLGRLGLFVHFSDVIIRHHPGGLRRLGSCQSNVEGSVSAQRPGELLFALFDDFSNVDICGQPVSLRRLGSMPVPTKLFRRVDLGVRARGTHQVAQPLNNQNKATELHFCRLGAGFYGFCGCHVLSPFGNHL